MTDPTKPHAKIRVEFIRAGGPNAVYELDVYDCSLSFMRDDISIEGFDAGFMMARDPGPYRHFSLSGRLAVKPRPKRKAKK